MISTNSLDLYCGKINVQNFPVGKDQQGLTMTFSPNVSFFSDNSLDLFKPIDQRVCDNLTNSDSPCCKLQKPSDSPCCKLQKPSDSPHCNLKK